MSATGEQTSLADRKRRAGQRLVIGFEGPAIDDDVRRLVAEVRPAGFVLFARNVVEPAQVRELNRELASLVDPHAPALLCVDQEGGRVQRIREPATEWPPMRVVGQAKEHTVEVSRALAREVRALGFNLNFAPCADVDSNPDNPVIGDRSFGCDPHQVAAHVAAFIEAHQAEGVIACAKHFPGHGDTAVDSHLDLPVVDRSVASLREIELVPFAAAVAAGTGSVMTSHVVFSAIDPDHPVTLSAHVLPRLLRDELDFDGLVFSDDMEMKAVAGRWSIDEQVALSTRASVDVLLCCRSPRLQIEAFEAMVRRQEHDSGFDRASTASVRRLHALRERFFLGAPRVPDLSVVGHDTHTALAARVQKRSEWSA